MCRSWLNPHQKEGIWDSDYCREQWKKDTHRKNSSRVLRQSPGSGLWPVNLWWELLREVFFFLCIFFNIWTQQQKRWDKTESLKCWLGDVLALQWCGHRPGKSQLSWQGAGSQREEQPNLFLTVTVLWKVLFTPLLETKVCNGQARLWFIIREKEQGSFAWPDA